MNSTGTLVRETFSTAFVKNFILIVMWLSLSYINISVVATFISNQIFYEDPRYILFIHMVINDAVQLTVSVILFVASYIFHTINVAVCCFFVFVAVFTTSNTPVNLAGMAIERYIAVCEPLRHTQICTVQRTYILIGFIWLVSIVPDIIDLFMNLSIEPISFFLTSVICLRENVYKDPVFIYKRQAFDALYFSLVFFTLVYTYLKVLFAAQAITTDNTSAQKARNTILLHGVQLLFCLLSYISPSVEVFLDIIFPGRVLEIRYATYVIVYIMPRVLGPIIYGVRDQKFCKYLKRYFIIVQCKSSRRVDRKEEN